MPILIKANELVCGYEHQPVLTDVSFEIGSGELWCILGPNGVGKSTLFRTLLGLLKPLGGYVEVKGKSLENWSRRDLAKIIAYVPQSHTPPFPFKVHEIIAMGRHPYQNRTGKMTDEDIDVIADAMEMLNISHLSDRIYTQISGGERQLSLLARAVAQQTDIMILDEPVSNLDFGNRAKVISHIRNFVSMGKTVIMTTHDPDHAFIPESNVLLMDTGKLFLRGKGPEVMTEEVVRKMYGVDNEIIEYDDRRKKTCVPNYSACPESRREAAGTTEKI